MSKQRVPVTEGGRRIGQTHPRAKLSDAAADQLFALRAKGISYQRLADLVGVSKSTVRDICNGRIRSQVAHHFACPRGRVPSVLIAPLPVDCAEPELPDDITPGPGPTVESLDLPPSYPEAPGVRALRLIAWALSPKAHQHEST